MISWDRPSAGYRDVLIQLELPSEAHGSPSILIHISNMGLIEKIQARLELYRLEQRYTRREKRTTFISGAQYVDGEYIYASSPVSTKSTSTSTSSQRMSKGPAVRIRELARAGTGRS